MLHLLIESGFFKLNLKLSSRRFKDLARSNPLSKTDFDRNRDSADIYLSHTNLFLFVYSYQLL